MNYWCCKDDHGGSRGLCNRTRIILIIDIEASFRTVEFVNDTLPLLPRKGVMMPHNKNGRPNREHRRGAGQIPFESQVRTSHNSRVLERDKLCIPWFVRVLVLL